MKELVLCDKAQKLAIRINKLMADYCRIDEEDNLTLKLPAKTVGEYIAYHIVKKPL